MATDKEIAYKILLSLCDSTYAKDLQEYKFVIQRDLCIPEDCMERLFDYKTLIELLNPDKTYKGRSIYKYVNSLTPVGPLSLEDHTENDIY